MFLGLGKNKKKKEDTQVTVKKEPVSVGEIYLDCASSYIKYQGKLINVEDTLNNKEFYQEWAAPFYKGAMYFVKYLENTYTDEVLASDMVIDLDLSKMLEGADETTKELFSKPEFPRLIYINDSQYSTHFHTDGKVVYEAEGIEVLPGLSGVLANQKINKLFQGLNPIEVRALLIQMNIYPKDTELDKVIDSYRERESINYYFLKSIICLLLIRKNPYDVKRARLFADSLGVLFDFKPFEKHEEQVKKFEL